MGSGEECDQQLRHDVDHERDKGDPDETKCQAFRLRWAPVSCQTTTTDAKISMSESSPKPARATERAA